MKQAEFISLMSEGLGVEEKTIRMIVRTLREAGLFTTGARGVNAPDITPLDAVRVIIAVVASPSPSRAVRDVKYFGSLKPDRRDEESYSKWGLGLDWVDENKTLEETLLDCLSNRVPHHKIMMGELHLSEDGKAYITTDTGRQDYHQREQWQALMDAGENRKVRNAVLASWEHMHRISNVKVNRSANIYLEILHQIGFEIIGWEVD
ncbi:hypothetical protein KBY28_05155 [Ruegeria pomeroyi]|uniref:hypothetical protein n=1 Tax=Ruegeria pomeroyi TaxID=89184 RepID=UPI001F34CF22|nr:hypothetical protein [Ruegeria pomeroyi]MCE8507837.1 hypothetical protein [Ruegeria pomeroyi]